MAPIMLESPSNTCAAKTVSLCSDPSVLPSQNASKRTKELWWLHGHPQSKRYSDSRLVSLAALIRYDAQIYNDRKAFLYPVSADASTKYESMSWALFDRVTETIALHYAEEFRDELREANRIRKQPTVALLGGGRNLEYFCTQLALQKLGIRVLLLAGSNAMSALHHLLLSCTALAVITDLKNSKTDTNGLRKLDMVNELPLDMHTDRKDVDAVKFEDFGDVWERHSFIIHTSGSTGMPKPIIHTNRSMMLIARMYRLFQDFSVENWFLLFPLYHIAGISIALSNLPNGQILSFPPLEWPPATSTIFAAWKTLASMDHPVDCVHCAPTLIENMYEYILGNNRDFSLLTSLKILQPGGAVLSDTIVEDLVANGVNVKTTYGSTEIGPPFRSIPSTRDNQKCYTFRNLYPDNPFLQMEKVREDLYECVVFKGFELAAELWEGKPEDEPYRTNDLFIQDPPGSGFFRLIGRRDDILVHTNGENTSAGPLQLDIETASKYIRKALAVGHSRPSVGLLVEVYDGHGPDCESIQINIWKSIQQVNLRYPSHSRISKDMIYILPEGKTLPVTPKGNVRRTEAARVYVSEIDRLYSPEVSFFISSQSSITSEALREYLRKLIASLFKTKSSDIKDCTTLYDLGIDSHLALSLRSSLSSYLNRSLPLGIIFENPSIAQLVTFFEPSSSSLALLDVPKLPSSQIIEQLIAKFSADFQSWPPRDTQISCVSAEQETVLLTGATGFLGGELLESLASSPKVSKIYALVRGPHSYRKIHSSLVAKEIDPSIISPRGKVCVLNFSMRDPLLGLDIDTYSSLAKSVTMVIQNAWKMDFNLRVEDFEGDCLRSTMSLLRFCHAGRRKTMALMSSVSTCMGIGQRESNVPEKPVGEDPSIAMDTGYTQSKYIAERLTLAATRMLKIPTILLRVGQLCGSTRTGHWNESEMWPIMFASAIHPALCAIPLLPKKTIDWIPVDIAAATITDVLLEDRGSLARTREETSYSVHHIVNPYRIPWQELLAMFKKSMETGDKIEEVSITDWVMRITALADKGIGPTELPALKLLQFFENMAKKGEESKVFETSKTTEVSRNLRECEAFCEEWMMKIMAVWKKSGFAVEP